MQHRKDIDGLRAIAVLPVVAFHAQLPGVTGGFVGVDVFFVISGYLIGSIILTELDQNTFSIYRFWERRVRRIFPALAAMCLVVAVLSAFLFFPSELARTDNSLIAAILSVSNFYFYGQSGYFAPASETVPLLHTWSLAVEEQYYLFLPLFLFLTRRFLPRYWKLLLWAVTLLSFVGSAVAAYRAPTAAFYLPHLRAWELLMGTLIAAGSLGAIRDKLAANLAIAAGMGLILFANFAFTERTPFPGLAALAPCAGAALVLMAGEHNDTMIGRLLAWRPLALIGLASYSIYIWHWPMIVFERTSLIVAIKMPGAVAKLGVCVFSIGLGFLSWRYIEQPFRYGPLAWPRRKLFIAAGAFAAGMCGIAATGVLAAGFPQRFSPATNKIASYLDYRYEQPFRLGTCFLEDGDSIDPLLKSGCLTQSKDRKNYLLFGDSYAADLWQGLHDNLPDVNIEQATSAGCTPTLTNERSSPSARCRKLLHYILDDYLAHQHVDEVIIAGLWRPGDATPQEILKQVAARGLKVVLVGPKVRYDAALPRLMASAVENADPSIPDHHVRSEGWKLEQQLKSIAASSGVEYVSFYDLLCHGRTCIHATKDDVPLSFDDGHLTAPGSDFVIRKAVRTGLL